MGKNSKAKRDAKLKAKKSKQPKNYKPLVQADNQIPIHDLDVSRKEYLDSWSHSANHYDAQGYYKWMAEQVDGAKLVLEVGCGNGVSTKALLSKGIKVVSVDENINCLKATEKLLTENGFKVALLQRETVERVSLNGTYTVKYTPIDQSLDELDTLLVEGDIANDPELCKYLKKLSIDTFVCWLIGSHSSRIFNDYVLNNGRPTSPAAYRILTQNRIYEVADEVLNTDGVLNIIDRGAKLTEDQHDALIQCHVEQASVTSLIVDEKSIKSLEYSETTDDRAMQMVFRNQATGETFEGTHQYFTSISARKG